MDEFDRLLSRGRARWRAKLPESISLWRFENWISDPVEEHHIGGRSFSNLTMPSPVSMHRELTRRSLEEHPPIRLGAHRTAAETEGRVRLHMADIFDCLADYLRYSGEPLIVATQMGDRDEKLEPLEDCHCNLLRNVGQLSIDAAERKQFRV